ncbi:META domain-containing protein [Candidatus Leptofilum sp.]|uniref:META domain-containing protein n=1 Tax=Candidatus Leptofilum sp. TaxID=3241576 RepID=UPI003B598ED0
MKFHTKFAKVFALSLLIIITMVACSPAGSGGNLEPEIDSVPNLEGSWVLEKFGPEGEETAVLPNTSITLNFEDGRIGGSAGCNSYFAEFTQADNMLSFGVIGATRMACIEGMEQEAAYLAALESVSSYSVADDQLTLIYENGTLIFMTAPADESSDELDANEEAKTLFVGPELVDCVGVAPQKCMQVKDSLDGEWTLFYDQIVGFEYEPGFEYELRVTETEIENPPADGSSIEVALVEIVSKTAVTRTPEPQPEVNELIGSSWVLVSFGSTDNQTAVLPNTQLTLNFENEQINGSAGCNSYFADATVGMDGSLEFGLMGSTLMACLDEAVSQQESDFLAALAQATSYTLADNQLALHMPDGVLLFVPASMHQSGADDAEVVDWETAVAILNSGDVVEIFQTHSLDVTLTLADGRIIKTVEPTIDDIFTAVNDCGDPCSGIMMATE